MDLPHMEEVPTGMSPASLAADSVRSAMALTQLFRGPVQAKACRTGSPRVRTAVALTHVFGGPVQAKACRTGPLHACCRGG